MAKSSSIPTTRRSLMAGALAVAAVPATSIVTTAALAAPAIANSDAGLIALCNKFPAAWAESNRLIVEASRIEDTKLDKFPRPDAMRVRVEDAELDLPAPYFTTVPKPRPDAAEWYEVIDMDTLRRGRTYDLKKTPFVGSDGTILENLNFTEIEFSAAAKARADEIVAAYDAWQKRQKRAPKGLRAAERQYRKAQREADRLMAQIADMPANTLEGVRAKAKCAAAFRDDMRNGSEDSFTQSLLDDLLDMHSLV